MEETLKSVGPGAAAVSIMWFMMRWLVRRLDSSDVQREAAHRELVTVLMTTIAQNTEALSKAQGAMDRNTTAMERRS